MEKVSKSSKLEFKDVMVSTKSKVLLKNVSGSASSGDLLAVMGPTGAGKTTFLNILAGRVSGDTGTITLNGSPLNKTQRRRLGYVSQDDIFLSNLTLWETLYFTAMIRIPDQVSQQEKTEKIYSVVDSLGLKKCLHTPIGDIFCRGISGGEKKRANIACELLTDPDILLIDEPTSGLDSSTAHTLMVQLKNYATEYNKTIVATIHQPSSQVFHMFSTLLLLVEGEVAYFGLANMVKEYFASLGMTCSQYYNPADFLMDILTKDTIRNMKEEDIRNIQSLQLPTGRLDGRSATESDKEGGTGPAGLPLTLVGSFPDASIHVTDDNYIVEGDTTRRWPTSFWTQFKMLNWRSYKQSKGRILHKFDLIQSAFIAAFVSRLFYQTEDSVNTVRDRMGLVLNS